MTLLRCLFTTKETGIVKLAHSIVSHDTSFFKYPSVNRLVFFPRHLMFVPFVKQIFCGGKIRHVLVRNVTDFFREELQVLTFCKTGKLTAVTDSDINQLLDLIVPNERKEVLGTFLVNPIVNSVIILIDFSCL